MAGPTARARATLAAALLVVCSACQVDIRVLLDAERDGSGEVRAEVELDRDAFAQVPDLAEQLRVDDLRRAGWDVEGPTRTRAGGAVVRATRRYATPEDAERAFAELGGDGGPFRDFELEVDRSFGATRTTFRGRVDLTDGIEGFSDDEVAERLGGQPLGVDPAVLEQQAGQLFSDIFRVEVAARLPGEVESNAPLNASNGAVWRPKLGEDITVEASATRVEVRNLALAATAGVSAVLFAVIVALQARRVLRRRWRAGAAAPAGD